MLRKILSLLLIAFIAGSINAQEFFNKKDLMSVGVYYYPEHWNPEQWERDIKNIADHGFEFIHMAEFAWAMMEPEEGKYDFSWLDKVIDLATKYKLKVILGTPTPCPPVWMGIKYPEIYLMDANYQREEHGARANMSLSNPVVLEKTQQIVAEMAKRYGKNKTVIGWQIDNEPEAKEDYSPSSQKAFKEWLKEKYTTVEALNDAWGTRFWSQLFSSFDEVHIYNATSVGWWGANPIALLDFKRYTADTQGAFLDFQAEELRKYIEPSQYITTNYVAKGGQTDPRRSNKMDFASFTAYPNYGSNNLGDLGFRLGDHTVLMYANDYYKSVDGVTGVMELQPGQVNWANHNSLLQPGTVRMWLWHCFAGGSSYACTYRYRQVLYGSEQYHHGIVTTDGVTLSQGGEEYVQVVNEMKQLRKQYSSKAKTPEILKNRKTAVMWSFDNLWNLDRQRQTYQWNTWSHMQRYQGILHSLGAPVSFITEEDDFEDYEFIVVPAYEMVDEALVAKWTKYVEKGGNLIISTRTGAKDKNAHLWESNLSGIMNDLIGGEIEQFDMLPGGRTGNIVAGDKTYQWSSWGDLIKPYKDTNVQASYDDQFYKGTACVLKKKIGKGTLWYIGTESTDGQLEKDILKSAYEANNVEVEDYPEGVFVQYRDGFWVAVNYSSENYELKLDEQTNVLIGEKVVPPAGVTVWQEK
ncbi:beta-galactosidase [Carboxylicivirga linearis]|uniref:Beta-galactosidase n=1 Tax=Carboxylicivirga linearis TaxID=1628157 RepID=A0ABS5JY38_9BACT|nr:beta-galactosidase [Carboxylicivirga linearis]MBS2099795.1 beta-galactosidase [Carboxylicivirga linearis]